MTCCKSPADEGPKGLGHQLTGRQEPAGRRIFGPIHGPNQYGIYRARVEIWDPGKQQWITKNDASTSFPDDWTPQQIEAAILRAHDNRTFTQNLPGGGGAYRFRGDSGHGFEIGGYFDNDLITTAYPVFVP